MALIPCTEPDFYKKRKKIFATGLFVGRRIELSFLWSCLIDFSDNNRVKPSHLAYVGQRKIGKSAMLTHFLDIVFHEQNEIVPLYYEFSISQTNEIELANKIVITWLKQWLAFDHKDLEYLEIEREVKEEILKTEAKSSELVGKQKDAHNLKARKKDVNFPKSIKEKKTPIPKKKDAPTPTISKKESKVAKAEKKERLVKQPRNI